MKIHSPKLIVDEKDPFKGALFERKEFADSLTKVLRNVSDGLVIFVNAPWGAGKTTFAQMWRSHLRGQKLDVIYYDAYAADYFDDPFVSFSGEIIELVDKRLKEGKGLIERRAFKKSAVEVGKRLAGLTVKVGIRAATLGVVESSQIDEIKKLGTEISSGVSEIGAEIIEKKIEHYAKEKDSLSSFKKSLAELAAKIRDEQDFPLTIIVDELDRCRPDFALGLLERMKHLFDVEGVAFVLLVNRDQIENYIHTVYGNDVEPRAYLLKFGNLFVDLPYQNSQFSYSYQPGRKEYCETLFNHYGLSGKCDGRFLINCTGILANHFDLTLREIERAFTLISIYYGSSDPSENVFLVAMLALLKVKRPPLYQLLSNGNIPVETFLKESALHRLETNTRELSIDWMKDNIDHCLMSEVELANAIAGNAREGLKRMGNWPGRKNQIPKLCWRLDQFSLQPS